MTQLAPFNVAADMNFSGSQCWWPNLHYTVVEMITPPLHYRQLSSQFSALQFTWLSVRHTAHDPNWFSSFNRVHLFVSPFGKRHAIVDGHRVIDWFASIPSNDRDGHQLIDLHFSRRQNASTLSWGDRKMDNSSLPYMKRWRCNQFKALGMGGWCGHEGVDRGLGFQYS